MTRTLQIIVDSLNPHQLADWWAETLGWDVETTEQSFIRFMIQKGKATPEQTTLHNGAPLSRLSGQNSKDWASLSKLSSGAGWVPC